MPKEILLLCETFAAGDLASILTRSAREIGITHIETLDALERACRDSTEGKRLIAFGTPIIVPGKLLDALGSPAYNLHPGPPNYPGKYPSSFAIYDGAERFGSTAHVMVPRVDAGPIVDVEWFDIPDDIDRFQLDTWSYQSVIRLFTRLAPLLATSDAPLPHVPVSWSGRKTTQKDFDALCALPADISEQEFDRRYRAVGEGPDHALTITLFGHRFTLDNPRDDEEVYVAGRAKD